MRSVVVTGPGTVEMLEVEAPTAGPKDVLVKMRASGICGSDAMYISVGGIPPHQGATRLGHEPAGEICEVGEEVTGFAVGDHVVFDTMAFSDGLLGSGGAQGGLSEYVVVRDAQPGRQLRVIPSDIPWEVAALNEPMAVARHAVNRLELTPGAKVVVFGAGPIGLGAALSAKAVGASHVVVVDIQPKRLETALRVGADAVINSAEEDVKERLIELHGTAGPSFVRDTRPDTDGYVDAAGAPAVIESILRMVKHRAVVSIPAVHKKPVPVDFGDLLTTEVDIRLAMGYPTEIFEVTDDIIANVDKYREIVSDVLPYDRALEGITLAGTPGAADKVVIVME
ncbi:zinc-dependent alcohol dehydrogenase [Georgenia faecalis]|uniref:Zinc-binding dehydrogenase n=1 Tax=Georgenia faecalis TaxID=2483799 RepID=A0ABV9DAF9_9MICO|nr:zinc-binding dehydrogenase [Georgenia faecalis]